MNEKAPNPEEIKSPELFPLLPNILLNGYSEEFRNSLSERLESFGVHKIKDAERRQALLLLDQEYVKVSIKTIKPFPKEVFA